MNHYPALIALALAVLLPGCHDGAAPAVVPTPAQQIVGTWRHVRTSVNGQIQNCPANNVFVNNILVNCTDNDRVTYRSDGSWTGVTGANGIYTITGGTVSIVSPSATSFPVAFGGSQMAITRTYQNPDTTVVETWERVP